MTSLGRIVTVCKGINRADSVSFCPGTKLILVPEPTCEFDKNAVKVCIESKFVDTNTINSAASSSSSSTSTSSNGQLLFCGYLPKVLVNHLATFISDLNNFTVLTIALDEKDDECLMLKHEVDNAFDLSLEFFAVAQVLPTTPVDSSSSSLGKPVSLEGEERRRISRVEQLKEMIASINSHHQNRI